MQVRSEFFCNERGVFEEGATVVVHRCLGGKGTQWSLVLWLVCRTGNNSRTGNDVGPWIHRFMVFALHVVVMIGYMDCERFEPTFI